MSESTSESREHAHWDGQNSKLVEVVTVSSAGGMVANYEVPDRFWGFVLKPMRVSRQHLKTILTVDISFRRFGRCTPKRHVLISPNVKSGNANGTDTSVQIESAIPVESGSQSPWL
jgi:hypothetical protein